MKGRHLQLLLYILVFLLLIPFSLSAAEPASGLSSGQLLYVPAYSDIYVGNSERPFQLTVTLSIRNIDPIKEITVRSVKYYETKGVFIKSYIEKPVVLQPMETLRYVIPEKDTRGGSGANFMVRWHAASPVNPPIVESVMIGSRSQQGISFTSRGKELIPHD